MTSVEHQKGRAGGLAATVLAMALAVPGALMAADTVDQLYERTLMTAADARCRLFAAPISAALDAARAQARGAALRSGVSQQQINALEQRARAKAGAAACNSKDLTVAAARVKAAFEGYAQMQSMTYPGDVASWKADRASSATIPFWRLSQASAFGADRLIFGLAGRNKVVTAAATFENGQRPYAARVILRDTRRTLGPYIDNRSGRALAGKAPPRNASVVFNAETRDEAPPSLLPTGAKSGLAFQFPIAAADAISQLDPREAVTIEFAFNGRGGEMTRKAYIEVGDFAAGRAFLH